MNKRINRMRGSSSLTIERPEVDSAELFRIGVNSNRSAQVHWQRLVIAPKAASGIQIRQLTDGRAFMYRIGTQSLLDHHKADALSTDVVCKFAACIVRSDPRVSRPAVDMLGTAERTLPQRQLGNNHQTAGCFTTLGLGRFVET